MIARFVTLLVILLAAASALAQTRHNTNAPIDFSADLIELQDRANRAIMAGDVTVRQAEMTLASQRMTVNYTGQVLDGSPQVSQLTASGGVTVTRPDQRARSQYAVYDLNRRVITMMGGVSLAQGGNLVSGGRLTLNLDTGRATLDGAAASGPVRTPDGTVVQQRGGRVTGRFSVPQRGE